MVREIVDTDGFGVSSDLGELGRPSKAVVNEDATIVVYEPYWGHALRSTPLALWRVSTSFAYRSG
jgi:hypothetical protein